jgi:hypothetical protein
VVTQDSLHMIFGGTSASAPVVAGFAALYFEKNPTATVQQLKQDIINCAYQDSYTQATPNNLWGYGKLDGYGALICSMPPPVSVLAINNSERVSIHPNPANDYFTVITSQPNTILEIRNTLGQEVKRINLNSLNTIINCTDLRSGIYFITLRSTERKVLSTQKLILTN